MLEPVAPPDQLGGELGQVQRRLETLRRQLALGIGFQEGGEAGVHGVSLACLRDQVCRDGASPVDSEACLENGPPGCVPG